MEIKKLEKKENYEDNILKFWKEKKIYLKSVKNNSKGKPFYFMDGPPYATGHIHMGTALNKILKDIAMRAHRLQGDCVFDRPGYDTHGVPIEFQIEKEIGSKSKKDIETFGVKNFIGKCKEYATKHIDIMNSEFENLGVWMDWNNPYLSLDDEYIEAIWDTFKEADKKGLLYLGKYPVHVCPRCETAVAYNEIEYIKQEDNSIYVKFQIKDKKDSFLIIWTTTPWTLPGNSGVMVNPEVDYQEVEVIENGKMENWIIAKELVPKIMVAIERGYNVKKEFKGKEMDGWKYINPLSKHLKLNVDDKNCYKVILSSRYVTVEDGSGLVHCAPGHGKEDYEVGKENNLEIISPVGIDGKLLIDAGKYNGKVARIVDSEIIQDLKNENSLVHLIKYNHDYPICWRCKTPLLMISLPQWFLKISDIHKKIMKDNEEVYWIPSWMKLRMKAWLEGISDWPISRERYWGSPLPIWVSEDGKEKIVVGSKEELRKLAGLKTSDKIDMHKPGIDKISFMYKGKKMNRVSGVLDVWFDSGVSSWAALGYPSNKKLYDKFWPANLNIEGKDQVRGWWNSQIILSEVRFGKKPFESISVHGMVLDLGKKKMSKSLGNILSPGEVIVKYNRDYLRFYFAKTSKGEDFSFDEGEFKEIGNIFRVLENVNNFVNMLEKSKGKIKNEDKWILSKFNNLVKETTLLYNQHRFPEVTEKLSEFLVNDLSRTYIKLIRERSDEANEVLKYIRTEFLKLIAPITPFITEKIWQELRDKKIVKEESVHLSSWPKHEEKKIDKKLEEEFIEVMKIIENGLAERDKVKIGLKWPLAKAIIYGKKKLSGESLEIITDQLNVKKVDYIASEENKVELDIKINDELESEGYARNISRSVQALRKKIGLNKNDNIELIIICEKNMEKLLIANEKMIKERTNAKKISIKIQESNLSDFVEEKVEIKNNHFKIYIRHV